MTERTTQTGAATPGAVEFRVAPAHRWQDFAVAREPRPTEDPSTSSGGYMSRRDFLRFGVITVGAMLLAACAPRQKDTGDGFPQVEAYSRSFPDTTKEFKRVWGADEFENSWNSAVAEALSSNGTADINLPEGEIFIDRKLKLEVPDGVSINVNSNSQRSKIKGSEELSVHPDSYGARENNVLEIGVGQGAYVSFEGVEFDGGSVKAGKGGYDAPPSPWNAVVAVYGRGAGDGLDNNGAVAKGSCEFVKCDFQHSQGPGLMVQNLENFRVAGCTTQATDCLITANWCNKGEVYRCYGQNVLSDFVFSVWSKDIVVHESGVNLAWAGYNFRSCTNIQISDCYAGYCLAAVSTSEVIQGSDERTVGLAVNNLQSWGCSCVYAFQHAEQVTLTNGVHDNLGEVLTAKKFMDRISNPEWVAEQPVYLGPNNGSIVAENEMFRKAEKAPNYYKLREQLPGCTFIGFSDQ